MQNKIKQRGLVLVLGLIFLAIASILVISSMQTTGIQEKITSNQKNKTIALMSAEAGAARFVEWLNARNASHGWPTDTASRDLWRTARPAIPQTSSGAITPNVGEFGYFWINPADVVWSDRPNHQVTVTVRGHAISAATILSEAKIRTVLRFISSAPNVPRLPAAITLGGRVDSFRGGNSENFAVRGGKAGPAIATDSNFLNSQTTVVSAITSGQGANRAGNYTGTTSDGAACSAPCVTSQSLGDTWSNPEKIRALIDSLRDHRSVQFINGNMDTNTTKLDSTKSVVIVTGDLTLRGGNYTSDGTNIFNGTIIVLGGTFDIRGGGSSTINGQIYVANIDTSGSAWQFRRDSNKGFSISGGGRMTINYVPPPPGGTGTGPGAGVVNIANWMEVEN